jgi:hypothetical protein
MALPLSPIIQLHNRTMIRQRGQMTKTFLSAGHAWPDSPATKAIRLVSTSTTQKRGSPAIATGPQLIAFYGKLPVSTKGLMRS